MAFLEGVTEKITKAGQGVAQSTKNMAGTVKLNSSIAEEEKQIKANYTRIGEAYYQAHKEEPEAEMAEWISAITESMGRIAEYREQLQKIKGLCVCPSCGAETIDVLIPSPNRTTSGKNKQYICPCFRHCYLHRTRASLHR